MIVMLVIPVVRRDVRLLSVFILPIWLLPSYLCYIFLQRRSYKAWLSTFEVGWTPKKHARGEGSGRIRL